MHLHNSSVCEREFRDKEGKKEREREKEKKRKRGREGERCAYHV